MLDEEILELRRKLNESITKDKAPEIIIIPCASAINKLVELKEKRDNYMKSRDCGNCEKLCCDCPNY